MVRSHGEGRRLNGARETRDLTRLKRRWREGDRERKDQRKQPSGYHLLRVYPHDANYFGGKPEELLKLRSDPRS